MRTLEPELVCPGCGEENSPHLRTNKIRIIDAHGQTACDACGTGGPVQIFKRHERTEQS